MKGFISYSHHDYSSLGDFQTHIRAVERAFSTGFWTDKRIAPGFYWNNVIEQAIESSEVFILLVSPGFIASDYIYDHEIPAIKAQHRKGALVLPVVLRRCMWQLVASALPYVNDETLRSQTVALLAGANAIVSGHLPEPKPGVADDLSGLMRGLLALQVPSSDPDLGRTPTLAALRNMKGLMIASVNDALVAAENIGLKPTQLPLNAERPVEISRSQIDGLLASLVVRLAGVEEALASLEDVKKTPTKFQQQGGLLNFYIGAMQIEINLTRMHLNISPKLVDLEGISRAIESMADLTLDFLATVGSWKDLLVSGIFAVSERVSMRVRRLVRGIKAIGSWMLRKPSQTPVAEGEQAPTSADEVFNKVERLHSEEVDRFRQERSLSAEIASQIPRLRRYARALTGELGIGDELITSALGTAIQEGRGMSGPFDLFLQFTKVISDPARFRESAEAFDPAFATLKRLSLLHRQVFLLLSMEGFSEEDAAEILSLSKEDLILQAEFAGVELAGILKTKVLIIEDDVFISDDLSRLIKSLGHDVIGVARTATAAIYLAQTFRPGLILADIQLLDGSSGLDAVDKILGFLSVPVVFITAYPERFLTAPRPEPAFLISKPYQPALVAAVASQAVFFQRNARRPSELSRSRR